jgi:hypothetical protein
MRVLALSSPTGGICGVGDDNADLSAALRAQGHQVDILKLVRRGNRTPIVEEFRQRIANPDAVILHFDGSLYGDTPFALSRDVINVVGAMGNKPGIAILDEGPPRFATRKTPPGHHSSYNPAPSPQHRTRRLRRVPGREVQVSSWRIAIQVSRKPTDRRSSPQRLWVGAARSRPADRRFFPNPGTRRGRKCNHWRAFATDRRAVGITTANRLAQGLQLPLRETWAHTNLRDATRHFDSFCTHQASHVFLPEGSHGRPMQMLQHGHVVSIAVQLPTAD